MKLNLAELADFMGVSLPTIRAWIRKGLPYEQEGTNGKEWVFDSPKVVQWKLSRSRVMPSGHSDESSNQELKRRRLEAETIIAELEQEKKMIELAEKKGLLVFIDDANASFIDAVITLKQRLLTIPRRLTPLVLGETDDRVIHEKIETEITEALEDISKAYEDEALALEEEEE